MNRLLVGIGLVALIAALVFLNQGVKKTAVPEHDEDAPQSQPQTKVPTTPVNSAAVLPAEETVGNPATAKHHITVGWIYTEASYSHPEGLAVPIQAVRDAVKNAGGAASAEIVNMDVPAQDRSPAGQTVTVLGLSVDGKTLFGGNPGDTPVPADAVIQQIMKAMGK